MVIESHVRIGCEKLCPTCEECSSLEWALVFRLAEEEVGLYCESTPINGPEDLAYAAIIDPDKLVELLVRCSASRGLFVVVFVDETGIGSGETSQCTRPICIMPAEGWVGRECATMVEGRAALDRVMKLPLDCGRDAVIAAFTASMN